MSAELEAEVAALRLMLREVAQTDATGIDYALRCQRERDEARAELATTKRELHRLIHGTAIEGDGACEHEIHADAARAWSRLWHREARRLWREVQALSGVLDDELGARTAMLALAHARRRVLESGYGHDVLDVARRAVEAVADAMLREGTP